MQITMLRYITPFALFALLTYAPELPGVSQAWAYPVKTVAVGLLLIMLWETFRPEIKPVMDWLAVVAGIVVFLLWVGLDSLYPLLGTPAGFNPYELTASNAGLLALIFFRMAGAVLVVPVMEEIFWRSFGLRVLMHSKFQSIRLGSFSWFSFIAVSVAFGFAHHQWLPGIIAGMIYAGVLYRTGNLFSPILAHAATNLLLGLYVLWSQEWFFW